MKTTRPTTLQVFALTLALALVREAARAAHRERDADDTAPLSPAWKGAHRRASALYRQAHALTHDAYDAGILSRPYWDDVRRHRFDPAAMAAAVAA